MLFCTQPFTFVHKSLLYPMASVVPGASKMSSCTAPVISHSIHKCDLCEFSSLSKHGVSVHMGHSHRKPSNCEDLESSQDEVIEQVDGNTEVEDEDKSEISKKSIKENELKTKSGYVTVDVKEVSKTYEIVIKESMKNNIDEELESFWEEIPINAFSTNKELFYTTVEISCWKFSESFTASSAASLLKSLPWPDGISVTSSKPTRYLEKNP